MRAPDGVHLERPERPQDVEVARQVRRVYDLELAESIASRGGEFPPGAECIVPDASARVAGRPLPRARLRRLCAQAEEERPSATRPSSGWWSRRRSAAGEPYEPIDIDAILDEDTVLARGPWRSNDLVEIALGRRPRASLRAQPRLSRRRPEPRLRLRALGPARHQDTQPTYAHGGGAWRTLSAFSLQYWLYTPSTTGTTCTRATGR